ncbi:transcriptional regulator [Pseudomonas aeruginosa VRFPA02]|nr:transcriptional regulator [Pseudomonas aeruginosa VRFPA02]
MKTARLLSSGALALSLLAGSVTAAVSPDEAAKLGSSLTPIGAQKEGNADGSIPAWTGGLAASAGKVDGKGFLSDPFADEKPLFTITAQNVEQYKDKLSDGQLAMFKRYPETYRIPVYKTHRTVALPAEIDEAVRQSALNVQPINDGNGLSNFEKSRYYAFPIPKNGVEVLWNHITRYRGGNLKRTIVQATPQTNGSFTPIRFEESVAFPQNMPDLDQSKAANILTFFKQQVTAPARLAGNVLLVHETLDQVKEPRLAWVYNAGQRRVRRAPQVAYDQVVWLALGGEALDPATFRRRLAGALGLPEESDEAQLCRRLRNASALWLLLDDYPRHPDPALDACLDRLLSAASPRVGWWLASRRRPQCNLARLLLEGELLEVDGGLLAFDADEVAELLRLHGRSADAATAGTLLERSGGWCAALRLRLLVGEETAGPLLQEYLQHELLDELPPPLADAARALAWLPQVGPELFRRLFEELPHGLDDLLARGFPLLADANQRYSLPPAIREAWREAPQRPQRDFHREACEWFAEHGETREAVDQALAADEPETAAGLLQKLTEEQLLHGHNIGMVLALRDELPAALLASTPRLVILNAWTLLYAGRLAEAEDCIGQLARFLPMPSASRQRVLLAQWQGLFGILLHCRGERGAADYLREALEQLPEDAWSQGLICRSALMQLAMIEGRMDQARLIGRDALRLAREHDSLIFEALIELERAQWLEQRGELLRAEGVLDRAQRYLEDLGQQGSPMLGRIALRRARLCLQQGREVEAGHWYRLGLEQARENLDPWVLYGYLGLALLEAGQGDLDAAFNRLLEVERLMQQRHVPDPLYRGALLLVSSALTLQQGRPAQAREILLRVRAYFQPGRARLSPPSEPELEARVEHQLALAELYSGEAAAAEARLRGLLAILEAQGRQTLLCEVRMGIAECQFLSGQLPQAQQTLRSGLELAERLGLQLPQRRLRDRQPQLFAALPGEEEEGLSPLSCRELAVLGLIAQGCSNQEIGEQLFISLHTVKTHARRINGKLGVARRTQAVARAKALGLLA